MQSPRSSSLARAPYRFAVLTAGVTFILLLVGGVVHGTGSSLACPDWPLCHGSLFPEMTGGVEFEHSHRILGMGVGLLTIALLAVSAVSYRRDRGLTFFGIVALAAVILQGVLGGLTVIYRLPTLVSWAHLSLSMAFFALLIYMAARARAAERDQICPTVRRWIGIATLAVYLQIVLGGLVRHTGAGLACLDVPFCNGELWRSSWHATAKVQMAHRFAGVIVALVVIGVAVSAWRHARGSRRVRALAASAVALILAQVTLGALSVWSLLGLWQVTAHLGVGALLLANMWVLFLATRPAPTRVPLPERAAPLVEQRS